MERYRGKSVSPNIAIGRIWFYEKEKCQIEKRAISDSAAEWKRYEDARNTARDQLKELMRKIEEEVGETNAAIFDVHALLMEDADYNAYIRRMIEVQMVNAEYAVHEAGIHFAEMFAAMDDEYFRARAADIRDISQRLVGILTDEGAENVSWDEPMIVVAPDLVPSETVQMDRAKVLAFVTEKGSVNSHAAILARTMNIPALTSMPVKREWNGRLAIVDGSSGILYVDPDLPTLERMRRYEKKEKKAALELQKLKGQETVTQYGKKIRLYANIGNVTDAEDALFQDAEGIGLFRSEFLYLEKNSLPTEKEQFESYRGREDEGQKGHHPDDGYRCGQAGRLSGAGKRRKSGDGIPGDPHLPGSAGNFSDAAACDLPCERVWDSRGHVSDDHFRGRSTGN